jgi:hypothetical protein
MMIDFFISYTGVDEEWAAWIAWILEEAGYTVFIQAWDILPGTNFVAEMQDAMTVARRTIAILSEDYFKSKYTTAEWTAAITRDPSGEDRVLVPIKVRRCEPKGFFATTTHTDIVGRSEQDARAAILGAFGTRTNPNRLKPEDRPAFPRKERDGRTLESPAEFPGITAGSSRNITDKIIDTSATDDILTAPLHQHLTSANKPDFTPEERLRLRMNLDKLSPSQFNMLIFSLSPPADAIPPLPAPQNERIDSLLDWAKGQSGRGIAEVRSVFQEMLKAQDELSAEQADADRGIDVAKTCNRRKQGEDFNTLFKLCNEKRRGHTQFYIIQGREMDGHKSLVERFCGTTIRAYARGVKPEPWELGWPQTGNLNVDLSQLVSLLSEEAEQRGVPLPVGGRAGTFRGTPSAAPPVVVIMHKLDARDWMHTTRRLIRSYVEFWDGVKDGDDRGTLPLVIVFFNVVYPYSKGRSRFSLRQWHSLGRAFMTRRVKFGLWRLSKLRGRSPFTSSAPPTASVALLKDLTCVTVEDVREWLSRHRYSEYEAQCDEQSQYIFTKNKWELSECRSMADVEWALSKFVVEMTPKKGAYT